MSAEILAKLDDLKTDLGSRFDRLEACMASLEGKVDTVNRDLLELRRNTTDNFEILIGTPQARVG